MSQPNPSTNKRSSHRKPRVVSFKLDVATRDEIGRRVPAEYPSLSALVRAGIAEILAKQNRSANRGSAAR